MKTFPLHDKQNQLHAFEVKVPFGGRFRVSRIASNVPNSKLLKTPKFLSWFRDNDIFCEFSVNDKKFTIEESFGDNSRYLIGSNPSGHCKELEIIEKTFKNA